MSERGMSEGIRQASVPRIGIFRPRPSYYMSSVDKALQAIQTLRDSGPIRLTEFAKAINASRPAAHRLLRMLIYRGFAVQDSTRAYSAGPAIGASPLETPSDSRRFLEIASPHMENLAKAQKAVVSYGVLVGTDVRYLGVVGDMSMRHGDDNKGAVLPAAHTVTGRSVLAALPPSELRRLYQDTNRPWRMLSDSDFAALLDVLSDVRRSGFAIVRHPADGRTVVGMAIPDRPHHELGAFALTYAIQDDIAGSLEQRVAALRGLIAIVAPNVRGV
jgi:IclR family transcriptional regulator, acetate operon repressor